MARCCRAAVVEANYALAGIMSELRHIGWLSRKSGSGEQVIVFKLLAIGGYINLS